VIYYYWTGGVLKECVKAEVKTAVML